MNKAQLEICQKYKVEYIECPPELKIGLAINLIGKVPVQGIRHPIEKGTAGWYIWCGESSEDDDFSQPIISQHISEYIPQVIPFLALPPSHGFIIDSKGYEDVWYDENFLNT